MVGPLKAYSFSDLQAYRMSSLTMVTVTCSGCCPRGAWNTDLHLAFATSHKHGTKAQERGKSSLDPIKTKNVEWKGKLGTAEHFQIVFGMLRSKKTQETVRSKQFYFLFCRNGGQPREKAEIAGVPIWCMWWFE